MATKNLWSREELILTLNLYLKLPFGKLDRRTPEVQYLAKLIGRTDNAVSIRLNNFAAVDPILQKRGIKGLTGGMSQVKPIWDEFIDNKEELLFESERILAELERQSIEQKFEGDIRDIAYLQGEEKIRAVKTRVNQQVFRQIVLANYKTKCAITGINIPELLLASHILPWATSPQERLNPENGICLSALYDKGFDKGLIGIKPDYRIVLSSRLQKAVKEEFYAKYFSSIDGIQIFIPDKYPPKREFLEFHMDTVFQR